MREIFYFILFFNSVVSSYGQRTDIPYVVLVSFDGFRHDYVDVFDLPTFRQFAAEGARAESLIPSFPSKTFPNHYSIVTGLYPGNHGLVDNSFYDPDGKQYYRMSIPERVRDPNYYGGIPLWNLAKQHHLISASYFWVGTELPEKHPDYYYPYKESTPDTLRVDQVISWLKLPPKKRPHFITLYFSSPDHEGHLYGPLSKENHHAVKNADQLLKRLLVGLDQVDLPVNIILVSDHGMSNLKQRSETYIFLDEIMNLKDNRVTVVNSGSQAHIYVDDDHSRDSIYSILKDKEENYSVFRQSEFPLYWNYVNKRSGDLLITAHEGFYIRERDRDKVTWSSEGTGDFGVHGYDPHKARDMHGIFLAKGPNIKPGVAIAAFENIHIYPLIAKILRLKLPVIDGKEEVLQEIYRNGK